MEGFGEKTEEETREKRKWLLRKYSYSINGTRSVLTYSHFRFAACPSKRDASTFCQKILPFQPAWLCTERMSCKMSPLFSPCFYLYLQCRQPMLSWEPAWLKFKGPVYKASAEVLMADIFAKLLPMETFHAKARLNRLQSFLHVRVEKYLEQLVKDSNKSSPLHSRKMVFRCVDSFLRHNDQPHLFIGKEALKCIKRGLYRFSIAFQ